MRMSPDEMILFEHGFVKINFTIVTTWAIMLIMVGGSILATRKLSTGMKISRWQNILEIIVLGIKQQIEEIGLQNARKYLGFLGTLFLFLFLANLMTVLPVYEPPTGSLSTTAALAVCVFFAVPVFNIIDYGLINYLKSYLKPSPFLLPFHIINELTRTVALAVRLFGNMMSGVVILAILLSITPLIIPLVMNVFGLLIGTVQAYIFSTLATVFIAAAAQESKKENE
jgi:F-type H+-transporting ATPase subunit a